MGVKAKVDTGARTSAIQASEVRPYDRAGEARVRFLAHAEEGATIEVDAPLLEHRWIKDSGGHATHRPIIVTQMQVGPVSFEAEMSLAPRADMGFRMLLGREAVRGRFLVDPGRSYLAGEGVTVEPVLAAD